MILYLVMNKIFGVNHLFPLKLTLMNLQASVKNNVDLSGSNDMNKYQSLLHNVDLSGSNDMKKYQSPLHNHHQNESFPT